jgi:hypothetical protein
MKNTNGDTIINNIPYYSEMVKAEIFKIEHLGLK